MLSSLLVVYLSLLPVGSSTVDRDVLTPFSYGEVTLQPGLFQRQASEARKFYLDLDEDSLLQGFRLRAGLPAPGKPLGGWYDPDGFAAAHPFGQFISALSRMYAQTGDRRFKDKVGRLVRGFNQTIRPDDNFYASAKVEKEWPCYLYDKNCTGMRDAFTLTGNREALQVLRKMTDYAYVHMPKRSDEWYTLPENLLNCYQLTGDKRYLEMASWYDYSEPYYNTFAGGKSGFKPELHAYSHINSLSSAARLYAATRDKRYLKAIESAWLFLNADQMYASGGWGPDEHFVDPEKGGLEPYLSSTGQGFETPCGVYANVNLDRYLLRFTGDAKYGDNMERVLYNGMLASLPPLPDGHGFYYSDYRPGTRKIRREDPWTCCTGTYAEATSDYPINAYFKSKDALWVNLFVPSTVKWRRTGSAVMVSQTTDYPSKLSTKLSVYCKAHSKFKLKVRVPSWVSGRVSLRINGAQSLNYLVQNGFATISRVWKNGDSVQVELPTHLRFEPLPHSQSGLAALMYGPLLLVAISSHPVSLQGDFDHPWQWIKPSGSDFVTADGSITFRPFHRVKGESYTTYISKKM